MIIIGARTPFTMNTIIPIGITITIIANINITKYDSKANIKLEEPESFRSTATVFTSNINVDNTISNDQ